MTELVNLRIARKRRTRANDTHTAAANRIAHGVSSPESRKITAERFISRRKLDQHKIETGERS